MSKPLIRLSPEQIYGFVAGIEKDSTLLPDIAESRALIVLSTYAELLPSDEARKRLLEVLGYTAQSMFSGEGNAVWIGLLKLKQLERMWSGDSTDYDHLVELISEVMPHKDWSLDPKVGGE